MKSRWLLGIGVLLVLVLVGGRWFALETAERAWAASITGGDVYLEARSLARLFSSAVLLFSITWATANLYFVYRAIGSVQMPRRLGDLEIVEAIPHRVLLSVTIISGVVFGVVLTWGTGDWWLDALLASAPPQFGVTDPILSRDLGYYAGVLPWTASLQDHALAAVATITAVVGLLYIGMGSLRWVAGRPEASAHARGHLGLLLATLAVMFAWGALLDPAELVGGLHGAVDRAAIDFRMPGSEVVAGMAVAVALASLAWGWLGRPNLLVGGWLALVVSALMAYLVVPAAVRGGRGRGTVSAEAPDVVALRETAFGIRLHAVESLPAFADPVEAARAIPVWDPDLVIASLRRPLGGVGLDPTTTTPTWLAVPKPDEDALDNARPRPDWNTVHRPASGGGGSWASTGAALRAIEVDTGIALGGPATPDTALWFGPGFLQFAVADPGVASGIALTGRWRRTALAWALQSPELARRETDGLVLLWRREVKDRLERVAPFAVFGSAQPAVADGALWWLAHGYVASEVFPLMTATPWDGRRVRYLRAGLVGRVNAATGETRISFVPGADSLTAAWAHIFAPLVEPAESLPRALRGALRFPRETFDLAAASVTSLRPAGDTTTWRVRPRRPFDLVAGGAVWTAQALETGTAALTTGLLAGAMTADGPRLVLWRSPAPARLPAVALGSADRTSGPARLWPAGSKPFSLQGLFTQREGQRDPPRLFTVYVAWGDRVSEGPTVSVALRDLLSGRLPTLAGVGGTAPQRLEAARRILAQADSALAAHDMERFGRLYDQLRRLLAPTYRPD